MVVNGSVWKEKEKAIVPFFICVKCFRADLMSWYWVTGGGATREQTPSTIDWGSFPEKKTVSCQFEFVQLSVVFLLVSTVRYLSSRNVSVGFNLEGLYRDFSGLLIFISLLFANVLSSLRWPSKTSEDDPLRPLQLQDLAGYMLASPRRWREQPQLGGTMDFVMKQALGGEWWNVICGGANVLACWATALS